MEPVASSERVKVYCQKGGKFSFFNSPYPAHSSYSAVDIYSERSFNRVATSPVYGEVMEIRRVNCPEGKCFEGTSYDYVILLCSLENPKRLIKILHVEPSVKVGDVVKLGDSLGSLLRSGFFDFWTDPHIHVEVRDPKDPIRARGGFKFESSVTLKDTVAELEELSGTVVESRREYSLVALNSNFKYGIPVNVDEEIGLLDAGIPHYGLFGVHMRTQPLLGSVVKLCGVKIGSVKSVHSNMCVAKCSDLTFKLNSKPVRLSFYLYLFKPFVKVIPSKFGELKLKKFEETSITIS